MKLRTKIPFSIIVAILVASCFGCQPSAEEIAQKKAEDAVKRQKLFEDKLEEYAKPGKTLTGYAGQPAGEYDHPYVTGKVLIIAWETGYYEQGLGKSVEVRKNEGEDVREFTVETDEELRLNELEANTPDEVGTAILLDCHSSSDRDKLLRDSAGRTWPWVTEGCYLRVIDTKLSKVVGLKCFGSTLSDRNGRNTVSRNAIKWYILKLPRR